MRAKTLFSLALAVLFASTLEGQTVTTSSLLDELIDLERLSRLSAPDYEILHFSSFDRSSLDKARDQDGWYGNSDGFGREPTPNFLQILEEPDEDGQGKYLICDVEGPGAIVRLWTARMTGRLEVYLDNLSEPVYDGAAEQFFKQTYDALIQSDKPALSEGFSQHSAGYYPLPFSGHCKIIWTGDIHTLHFYYLQVRKYVPGTAVRTFSLRDIDENRSRIRDIQKVLIDPGSQLEPSSDETISIESSIVAGESREILKLEGPSVITELTLEIQSGNMARALRQNILRIVFDDYTWGQVQAPVGDFFGTAQGINPSNSLPFTVSADGTMVCRFVMPFRSSCRIYIDNLSDETCSLKGGAKYSPYEWEEGRSMYFHAKWRTDHELIATNKSPKDLVFLMANGKGRYVGTAVYLMNPASAPRSGGNWWGEGDEKIFIDHHEFPSVFGTGSEDYFGYAWSDRAIFSHAYIGQPRNDGPGNRGFVTNYRYHIIDDLRFDRNLNFYMELLHHDSVPDFSYSRIAYYYGLPGIYDDHQAISPGDVRVLEMPENWQPKAYFSSRDFVFHEPQDILEEGSDLSRERGYLWSGNHLMIWAPENKGERLVFHFPSQMEGGSMEVYIAFKKSPGSGSVRVLLNGTEAGADTFDLRTDLGTLSREMRLQKSIARKENRLELIFEGETGEEIGIDFISVRTE